MRSQKNDDDILDAAAQLIIENGRNGRELSIKDLAERAMVKRPTIHYVFRDESGVPSKTAIYRRIVNEFLLGVQEQIKSGLEGLGPAATPIEKMMSIIMSLHAAFRKNSTYGKVTFLNLNLSQESSQEQEESKIVYELFAQIDLLIKEAKDEGEIASDAINLDDWKIRQVVFAASRGLLLTLYLKECQLKGTEDLSEEEVIIEVLRIVKLYCSEIAAAKVEKNIQAIRKLVVKAM